MKSYSFKPKGWLLNHEAPPLPQELNDHAGPPNLIFDEGLILKDEQGFGLSEYFTPGWKGEGLLSKRAIVVQKALYILWKDALIQLKGHAQFNRSLKQNIFDYFLSYANQITLNCPELSNYSAFWNHVDDENSPYRKHIDNFINIYTFRGVSIFLFKLKFVFTLGKTIGFPLSSSLVFNLNTFLNRIFPKGSSADFYCESLQSNQYSWYRPNNKLEEHLGELVETLPNISINEMMKICTYRIKEGQNDIPEKVEGGSDLKFSHPLSHKSFGLFITDLLLNYPKWSIESEKTKPINNEIISVKFAGEYLFSLSQGHWLAQEASLNLNWDSIICPDFHGEEFSYGSYIKICHELHFLSFLVRLAKRKKVEPISFIGRIMRGKYNKSKDLLFGQVPLLTSHSDASSNLVYDRIVLTLLDLPKRNPHYHVLSKIQSFGPSLAYNGLIYIFTNQNLFVPSQSDKIEHLLKEYKLEGFFNFEGLKGKGEMADFLYIFSKQNLLQKRPQENLDFSGLNTKKYPCLSFNFTGELFQFHYFQKIGAEFRNFLATKNSTVPLYQKEIDGVGTLEFHQDAILDGKILHSMTSPDKMTHPRFFKGLTQESLSFEQIFQIESLDEDGAKITVADQLLGVKVRPEVRYPFILIVNLTNFENITLEIVKSSLYHSRIELYGKACFQYYGLIPKISNLNLNVLKNYFQSEIGNQIIQFSLNGGPTKIKGKLKGILIPKALSVREEMPANLQNSISLISYNVEKVIEIHPNELSQMVGEFDIFCQNNLFKYPWHILSMISESLFLLSESLAKVHESTNLTQGGSVSGANYQNPLILGPLLKLPTHAIYPKNQDIFVDFINQNRESIHSAMTQRNLGVEKDQNYLEICSENGPVLRLYSSVALLKFIHFILGRASGSPISSIISNLKVPRSLEIENILTSTFRIEKELEASLAKVKLLMNESFKRLFVLK